MFLLVFPCCFSGVSLGVSLMFLSFFCIVSVMFFYGVSPVFLWLNLSFFSVFL